MVIKTLICLLAARQGCSKIYWLSWIFLGLSVITLLLKVLTNEHKSLWRAGWSFSYQSTGKWAKTCGLKAQTQGEGAEIKGIRSRLAQIRKWINRQLSVCEISSLNSNHCCHLPTDKWNFCRSLKLWFWPDELTHLAADAKNKATHIFPKPPIRGSYFRLKSADFRLFLNATWVTCALMQQVVFYILYDKDQNKARDAGPAHRRVQVKPFPNLIYFLNCNLDRKDTNQCYLTLA